MPASFPASTKNFGVAKQDFTDTVLAGHINDAQDEVVAIEANIGAAANVGQDLIGATTTYATLKTRIDAIMSGVRTHTHAGADGVKLSQANTHQAVDTDVAVGSIHHTLGTGATQAATGNHTHTVGQVSGAAVDSNVVHLAGTETITGDKNFTGALTKGGVSVVLTNDTRLASSAQTVRDELEVIILLGAY